jgi:hypothetical protein
MRLIIYFLLYISGICCFAQIPSVTSVNGEIISSKLLDEIILTPLKLSAKERLEFNRLKKKVLKVYPYAKSAKIQFKEIEEDFLFIKLKREKRKISKLHDRWLREHFTYDLKKLTRSEGQILSKLIHYETGKSSFKLIKEYRSGLNALLWQKIAKLYDGNLKTTFAPSEVKEDLWIEHILRSQNRK